MPEKSALFIMRSGHTSTRFSLLYTLYDKPCASRELRDTTCASQQHDSHTCQSRSPHSFVHLRHCLAQLETDQPTSDTSRGCIGNGRKQNEDASSHLLRSRTQGDRCVVSMSITSHLQAKWESDHCISDAESAGSSVRRLQHVSSSRTSSTTLSVETSPA